MESVWYDPAQGFHSVNRFHEKFPRFPRKDVEAFIKAQPTWQLNKQPRRPSMFRSVIAPRPGHNFQVDILVYDRYKMNNYKYILTVIDVHSRYAAARALTNREAPTIKSNLQSIFEEMGVPLNINCDQEFSRAHAIRDWLGGLGVTIYESETDQPYKNAIVERFNRTLATLLQKWRTSAPGLRHWPKVLPDILFNYNHTRHSTIKETPADVFNRVHTSKQQPVLSVPSTLPKVGESVRLRTIRSTFDKGDLIKWSRQVYVVADRQGEMYRLKNPDGLILQRRYKPTQLLKI